MPNLQEPIQLLVESRYRGTEIFRKSVLCRCGDTSEITKFRSTCLTQTSACRGSNGRRSRVDRRLFAARRYRGCPAIDQFTQAVAVDCGVGHDRDRPHGVAFSR